MNEKPETKPTPPNKPNHPDNELPSNKPTHPTHPEAPGNKPDWKPETRTELTDEEKKGIKRLGTPTTQSKAATLGTTNKEEANMELNKDPRVAEIERKKTEEEKFINKDNPDLSPGYMHDHDSKVSKGDEVTHSRTDKSPTITVAKPRISTREAPLIPEPISRVAVPNPQILPQNKEDLMATINAILKVTSADSQQLEYAMARISSLIPAGYNPRVFPFKQTDKDKMDDSSKRTLTEEEYRKNRERDAESHSHR